ncbi:TetR/AcrR family transcriptional regulator (plasmid) [Salipiger sp. H15]|uniref:TetR/AcrR family transcriptional regulator n=1 Tax=Alloyangia sp. H15 TaxID=3029062 RepID=A0AAU8ASI7_9RHOB
MKTRGAGGWRYKVTGRKNSKDHILDVVEQLCAEVGPYRLRHAQVARHLGIKPPSLYAHFPSMNDMLAAATRRALEAIRATYEELGESISPAAALDRSQARQVDLLVARPGIARLVLFDLSQPGGAETVAWDMPEIEQITACEEALFDRAVAAGQIPAQDFPIWFSTRMGALYVGLSYEWLRPEPKDPSRIMMLKKSLQLTKCSRSFAPDMS